MSTTEFIALPDAPPVAVLHSDKLILAVNKPEGMASIPESATDQASLRTQLETALATKLFVVHRLDKDVSGVIVFARDADTHRFINQRFQDREVQKTYLALVSGVVARRDGCIDEPLREFGSGRMGVDRESGKPSTTRYRIRERFPAHTLLALLPLTGRRHQLRVHLYSIGHPIAGDPRYGDRTAQTAYPRLMLHARALVLPLPTSESVRIEAPLSPSFETVLTSLRPPPITPCNTG
ncbi:MAG: RluA family pseudouridine synthase [Verrucomicrobia bacterium]|nr:RluA family pseudouridine synthase [Verrucomicrobiota bacterium]